MTKTLYDIKEISTYLGMSVPYLRKLTRAKLIPHYRVGNSLRFKLTEVDEWLENKKVETKKSILLYQGIRQKCGIIYIDS